MPHDGGVYAAMAQELCTERLLLRPRRVSDGAAVRRLWRERDPRVPAWRRIDADGHPTRDEIAASIAAELSASAETGLSILAIERRSTPGLIGYCGLTVGGATAREPELVFELARSQHGRGYATEAAHAIVRAARMTGRCRLWASVREWNTPSFRVLGKLGFTASHRRDLDPDHGDTVWLTLALCDGQ